MFKFEEESEHTVIALVVDDVLIYTTSEDLYEKIIKKMKEKFDYKTIERQNNSSTCLYVKRMTKSR